MGTLGKWFSHTAAAAGGLLFFSLRRSAPSLFLEKIQRAQSVQTLNNLKNEGITFSCRRDEEAKVRPAAEETWSTQRNQQEAKTVCHRLRGEYYFIFPSIIRIISSSVPPSISVSAHSSTVSSSSSSPDDVFSALWLPCSSFNLTSSFATSSFTFPPSCSSSSSVQRPSSWCSYQNASIAPLSTSSSTTWMRKWWQADLEGPCWRSVTHWSSTAALWRCFIASWAATFTPCVGQTQYSRAAGRAPKVLF